MILTVNYRAVGGFIHMGGTQICRIRFAFIMALFVAYAGLIAGLGVFQVFLVFLGSMLGAYLGRHIPHSPFMASDNFVDCLLMGVIGTARLALIYAPLAYYRPFVIFFSLFGLLSGLGYYIGWKYLKGVDSGIYYSDKSYNNGELQIFAKGGGEWGEVLTGLLAYEIPFWLLLLTLARGVT